MTEPRAETDEPQDISHDESQGELPYEPPRVESVELSDEAAEALT